MRNTTYAFFSLAFLLACGDDDLPTPDTGPEVVDAGPDTSEDMDAGVDAGRDGGPDAGPPCGGPPGLYADPACSVLADGVVPFNPRYWLWSDGTDKQRFISLPEGTTIDTRNPDSWVFPRGTRIWKNFDLDGRHLETRLFEKNGDGVGIGAWLMRTFQWNEEQDAVVEVTMGAENVLGTDHDIPSQAMCVRCHNGSGSPDIPLGFSAIQLNHGDTSVTLAELEAMGWLSHPIDTTTVRVPGDPTTQEALGYLHANCAHCHGGVAPMGGLNLQLLVGHESPRDTNAYMTGVDQPSTFTTPEATTRIARGAPDASTLIVRMESRVEGEQMPPVATEIADPVGLASVRDWILSL